MQYEVKRMHLGDKLYVEGDKRIVKNKKDAEELARMGLIAEEVTEIEALDSEEVVEPKAKQAATPENKMAAEPEKPATGKKTASKATETNAE